LVFNIFSMLGHQKTKKNKKTKGFFGFQCSGLPEKTIKTKKTICFFGFSMPGYQKD